MDEFLRFLLRIWRTFPLWVHILAARIVRPRYQVAVAAIIFDADWRILLLRHTYRKFEWGLPAGGLESEEDPETAVVREFREETGLEIQVEKMLKAVSTREYHHVSLIYLCSMVGGEFRPSLEVSEMRYFHTEQLPAMLSDEKELIRDVSKQLKAGPIDELA